MLSLPPRVKHANHGVSLAAGQGTVFRFFFWPAPWLAVELDRLCGVEFKGNDRTTQCDSVYMVRPPRGSYTVYPMLSLEVATPQNKSIHSTLLSICKKVRLTSGS